MKQDEIWKLKLSAAIEDFQGRAISDDVFRAYLYSAGFRGVRLQEEFNYQDAVRFGRENRRSSIPRAASSVSNDSA